MDYCVITFSSTNGAIQAQAHLKGHFPFQIMPVLREISKGCGISVRFAPQHLENARAIMDGSSLDKNEYAFYAISGHGAGLQARPLD